MDKGKPGKPQPYQKDGSLTITSKKGDISEAVDNARNILLQSANTDWIAETKLTGSRIPSQPENAAIIAYQDDSNFVKLMFRAVTKRTGFGQTCRRNSAARHVRAHD